MYQNYCPDPSNRPRQHIKPTIRQYPLINYLGTVVDDGLLDDNILQDLACEARKEIIPRFSRAKNVDNKWVYLAQLGHREFQEVEVIICRHPEQKCVNGVVHQTIHPILNPRIPNFIHKTEHFSPIVESFYSVKYGLSIIMSIICQIISVMKT